MQLSYGHKCKTISGRLLKSYLNFESTHFCPHIFLHRPWLRPDLHLCLLVVYSSPSVCCGIILYTLFSCLLRVFITLICLPCCCFFCCSCYSWCSCGLLAGRLQVKRVCLRRMVRYLALIRGVGDKPSFHLEPSLPSKLCINSCGA